MMCGTIPNARWRNAAPERHLRQREDATPKVRATAGRPTAIFNKLRAPLPTGRGEQRDRDRGRKEELRQAGVADTHRLRKHKQNRNSSEHTLEDDCAQCREPKPPDPRALLGAPKPDCENNGEESDRARDHPVAVLVENAALHFRHHLTVRKRPIRHGKTGLIAGYGCACDD